MKVTLINSPITQEERYNSVMKGAGGKQAPLGLCFLAAVLRENKYDVDIIDAEARNLDYAYILENISFSQVVGITACTVSFFRALELARLIRKHFPKMIIILGGPHSSCMKEHPMTFDVFDFSVYGEGELTLLEIVNRIKNKESLDDIRGTVIKRNDKIIVNQPRPYIEDLDSLPFPAVDLLKDFDKLYSPPVMNHLLSPCLNIITSRGCPNSCSFCEKGVFGSKYRYHSAEYIMKLIDEYVKKYKCAEVSIVDDTYSINKARAFQFCKLMKEKYKGKLPWNARISENSVTKEMLKAFREAGCWYLEIGCETGSPRVLKDIGKGTTHEKLKDIIAYADSLKFHIKGFFMIGYSTDNKESIEQTIAWAKSTKLTDIVTTIFTPFEGTRALQQAKEHGTILVERDWSKFNNWSVVYLPNGLTEKEIYNYWKKMYLSFYLRPSIVWAHLKRIRSFKDIKKYFRGAKVILRMI